jgi:hypothetical protein
MTFVKATTNVGPLVKAAPFLGMILLGSTGMAAFGQAAAHPSVGSQLEQVAVNQASDYGRLQMQRLAANTDRDSLIAAVIIGLPNDSASGPTAGHAELLEKLVTAYPKDPLALYAAALICNVQSEPCAHPEYQKRLLQAEPHNAINVLLLPNAGALDVARLHQAAMIGKADTHFSALLGIVRSALVDQPAPGEPGQTVDDHELALVLRRNEVGLVPWPKLAATTKICSAAAAHQPLEAKLHADCVKLGQALFSEASQNMVARSFGGTLLRRFAPGTPAADEAIAFRRRYVWISELPDPSSSTEKELINEEEISAGEWEAFQRRADRAGLSRDPPADWVPKHPEFLLLPEERAATPAGG